MFTSEEDYLNSKKELLSTETVPRGWCTNVTPEKVLIGTEGLTIMSHLTGPDYNYLVPVRRLSQGPRCVSVCSAELDYLAYVHRKF